MCKIIFFYLLTAETNGCELCPACYQLINQALILQNMSLSSLKNMTDSKLQLFNGYSKYQIDMIVGDLNSTLQKCLWPMSLNITALSNDVYANVSVFSTVSSQDCYHSLVIFPILSRPIAP